jgi:hypothetical protein
MRKLALAGAVIALFAAGCGSGHRAAQLPSKADFVAAADRICAEATTRSGRVAQLRALRAPAALVDLYGHWLTAERDALTATRARTNPSVKIDLDPEVALVIAEGKIAGYSRRLGAQTCTRRATGRMPP